MISVGSFEAKTKLSSLLDKVAKGETVVITKHGKPVARLVPPEQDDRSMSIEEVVQGFSELRKARPIERAELLEWVREGRKY